MTGARERQRKANVEPRDIPAGRLPLSVPSQYPAPKIGYCTRDAAPITGSSSPTSARSARGGRRPCRARSSRPRSGPRTTTTSARPPMRPPLWWFLGVRTHPAAWRYAPSGCWIVCLCTASASTPTAVRSTRSTFPGRSSWNRSFQRQILGLRSTAQRGDSPLRPLPCLQAGRGRKDQATRGRARRCMWVRFAGGCHCLHASEDGERT